MDKKSDFILLSEPEFGWSTFSFPDAEKSYELSYLTDIAAEWLDKAIAGLEQLTPFCVHAYLEPGRLLCTVSFWHCHVAVEGEGREAEDVGDITHSLSNTDMLSFCIYLRDSIQAHLDSWLKWNACEWAEMTEDEREERRQKLDSQLKQLSALIESQAKHFGKGRGFY